MLGGPIRRSTLTSKQREKIKKGRIFILPEWKCRQSWGRRKTKTLKQNRLVSLAHALLLLSFFFFFGFGSQHSRVNQWDTFCGSHFECHCNCFKKKKNQTKKAKTKAKMGKNENDKDSVESVNDINFLYFCWVHEKDIIVCFFSIVFSEVKG